MKVCFKEAYIWARINYIVFISLGMSVFFRGIKSTTSVAAFSAALLCFAYKRGYYLKVCSHFFASREVEQMITIRSKI